MDKFTRLTATACPLDFTNLNTDQLLPARYLKWPRSAGIGKVLLQDLRFDSDGREQPEFPLNRPAWRGAKIIVGGRNFGCGSSREAAVYALYDYGIRCVIAPSYGDIFSGNAVQNGLLTAIVSDEEAAEIMATLIQTPELPVTVDLEQQTIFCACAYLMAGTTSRLPKAIAIESPRSKLTTSPAGPGPRPAPTHER
jgi:3-isopropylmalate/(R)-2-methylmalate dehydratase small subunit